MCRIYNSVDNRIGYDLIRKDIKPAVYRQLTGYDGCPSGMPVFDYFHEIELLLLFEWSQSEVIEYQQIGFSQFVEKTYDGTFYSGYL